MATSPNVSSPVLTEKERKSAALNLTPAEFQAKLKVITGQLNDLMKTSAAVFALKPSDRLLFPDGSTVGRREIKSLTSQLATEIKGLKNNYREHGRKKKRSRSGKATGFQRPMFVDEEMKAFFKTANLGPSDPNDPNSAPLNTLLAVGDTGVTTNGMMTPLFSIYATVNNMQQDPTNKQFLTATPEMDRYFSQTYQKAAAEPVRYKKNKVTGQPDLSQPLPKFDPKHFRYANIQTIVKYHVIKKPQLSEEHKAYLDNPEVKARLDEEQKIVSKALDVYRARKEAGKKAAKAAARQ